MSNDPYGVIKISSLEKRVEELEAELSARREVDEWLLEATGLRAVGYLEGELTAITFETGAQEFVEQCPDYPSLAAALRGVK